MSTKLNTITTQYRKFNTNQVLTENQLNEFLDYFEDQDHLTRIGLIGVGIVCGFKVTYNALLKTIKITQGYGVTTDGDLLALQKPSLTDNGTQSKILKSIDLSFKTYTHFRVYENDKVKYKPFFYTGDDQIDLWELQVEDELPEGDTSFSSLKEFQNLDDKVVLLYLENYSKEGDLCTELTCDNQGIEQVAKLKVLLVSLENAKYIAGFDSIYNEHDWYQSYLALPEVSAKRVILTSQNTKTFKSLKQNYYNAIKTNLTLTDLKLGYDVIFSKFNIPSISSKIASLFNISSNTVPLDFQYRYDLLKDLIDTYNEIKELLLDINVHCCPNIGSFPKHLMLGKLIEVKPYNALRHRFYKSPKVGHEDQNYKRVLSLLNRTSELVNNYLNKLENKEVKITPSQAYGELGDKAIPFYYKVDNDFLDHWSFSKYTNFNQKNNLCYHTSNLAQIPSVQQPLEFSTDQNDFYRIEGHQGKMYQDALDQILKLKEKYGLSFDVKLLSITPVEQEIDLDDYRCEFEDLSVLLKAWTVEQECVLAAMAKFFSGFSTKDVGKNIKDIDYIGKAHDFFPSATSESSIEKIPLKPPKVNYLYRKNVVEDNVTEEENTVGKYIKMAFSENKEGSINDIKNAAKIMMEQDIETPEWDAHADIRDFVIYDSIELIGLTYVLTKLAPQSVFDINSIRISEYISSLKDVCSLVKKLKVKYQKVGITDTLKQILGMLINQLSIVCCSGEKLKILLEEIEIRKEKILLNLQLSKYVKSHPGLEHRAGVLAGGTFIMVYLAENDLDTDTYEEVSLELKFLNQPRESSNFLNIDKGQIRLLNNERISTEFAFVSGFKFPTKRYRNKAVQIGDTLEETVKNLADYFNYVWRIAGASQYCKAEVKDNILRISIRDKSIRKEDNYIQFENKKIVGTDEKIFFGTNQIIKSNITKKNTVIADFALPYMCCSDCAPINFIIPKEPVFLSLPQPHICLDKETLPILFTISPRDGIVKAVVEEELNGGVDTNENGQFVFDARLLSSELYGKPIKFTVNDEETDCEIVVYDKSELAVSTDIQYNQGITQATVRFKVLGEISENMTFTWDLGNDVTLVEKPDAHGIFTFVYNLPVNDNNTVTPKLTVSNGFCVNSIIIPEITFKDPVDVNLRIKEKTCIDPTSDVDVKIPFTNLSPVDGTIKLVNAPIVGMSIVNNELVIKPKTFKTFNQPLTFTVNDLPTTAAITVFPIMDIGIAEDKGSFNWENDKLYHGYFFGTKLPANTNENGLTYEWIINEVLVGTEKDLKTNLLIKEGENTFNVTLNVTDTNGCTATESTSITIRHPLFKLSLPFNRLNYCMNDSNPYKFFITPDILGTIVEGPGVKVDANGNSLLIPTNIGSAFGNKPAFGIAGVDLLNISLHKPAVAAFTPMQVGNQIILKNQSTGSVQKSKWFVNNAVHEVAGIKDFVIDLKPNSPKKWSFKLEVSTKICGLSSTAPKEFLIAELENTCIKDTKRLMEKDEATIDQNVDLPGTLNDTVLMATVKLYTEIGNNSKEYMEGGKNDKLVSLFSELLDTTFRAITANVQNPIVFKELSTIYILQIKLFYNILHCQSHDILIRDGDPILTVKERIRLQLRRLNAAGIKFDVSQILKKYLTGYSLEPDIVQYIATYIKNHLIPLL